MPLTPAQLRARLGGVIAFPVTPFKKNLALDLAGLRRNLRKLVGQQVCAIVAGAGTGELHSLSTDEHLAVVKSTLEEVNGRHPVLAGVGFSPQTAVDMARGQARSSGAGATRIARSAVGALEPAAFRATRRTK